MIAFDSVILTSLFAGSATPTPWFEQITTILGQIFTGSNVAGIVTVLGIVAASGIALGSIKIKGISLGIAGVLFTGILFSHVFWNDDIMEHWLWPTATQTSVPTAVPHAAEPTATSGEPAAASAVNVARPHQHEIDEKKKSRKEILEFLREFGLILFVYSIGMQVGPGFFGSLRAVGLQWNLLAAGVVGLGFCTAWMVHVIGQVPAPAVVGILSGAVTNTPGLAAAQQALKDVPGLSATMMGLPGVGYAVAYPFGVIGIIMSMIALRLAFRVDPLIESEAFKNDGALKKPSPCNVNLMVRNPGVIGKTITEISVATRGNVIISRLSRQEVVRVARADDVLQSGDLLHAVGTAADLDHLRMMVGEVCDVDLRVVGSQDLSVKRLLVTKSDVVGKSLEELHLNHGYGVNITRINRAGVELIPTPNMGLHYGDTLVVVGDNDTLAVIEKRVGNSIKHLEHPQLIPMFFGIVVGVLLGQIPISIGLPAPVKLGLAGGPLVAALIFSRLGHVGRISFFIPHSANMMIRELGIVLFLACVGLMSGEKFVSTLIHGDGLYWMQMGALITVVPLLTMALIARLFMKLKYIPLCGIMAGSMTDPPALAFANTVAGNELPAIAYSTVYPLTMILRILSAQLFVIFFVSAA